MVGGRAGVAVSVSVGIRVRAVVGLGVASGSLQVPSKSVVKLHTGE